VVQTLHNYRLICASAELYRDGKVCEECLHHGLRRGVRYGCYQGSKLGTAALSLMLGVHRRLRTWNNLVDCYIALTEFARNKMIEVACQRIEFELSPTSCFRIQVHERQVHERRVHEMRLRKSQAQREEALVRAVCRTIGESQRRALHDEGLEHMPRHIPS